MTERGSARIAKHETRIGADRRRDFVDRENPRSVEIFLISENPRSVEYLLESAKIRVSSKSS
jgi:hypothetical protein